MKRHQVQELVDIRQYFVAQTQEIGFSRQTLVHVDQIVSILEHTTLEIRLAECQNR